MKLPESIKLYKGFIFVFLPLASFYFGYMGKPAEMGLAIVAGAIALAFANIDKIRKFKGAGFEAEMREQREQLDTMIAKTSEPLKDEGPTISVKAYGTDKDIKAVIKALGNPKYTWRYISGIEAETKLPKKKVGESIHWLVNNGFATEATGKQGTLCGLSPEGQELLRSILSSANRNDA